MKQKYFYYVAVDTGHGIRLITELDHASKHARWAKDGKPLNLTRSIAQDIAEGLCMNLYPAFVLTSFFEIEYQFVTNEVGIK